MGTPVLHLSLIRFEERDLVMTLALHKQVPSIELDISIKAIDLCSQFSHPCTCYES